MFILPNIYLLKFEGMYIHEFIYAFISSFIALFPVIDPIGVGFIINSFLGNMDVEERKSAIRKIIFNCLLISLGSMVAGHFVLLLFGLAIPIIQVGGGIVICKTGWEWLSESKPASVDHDQKTISKIYMKDMEDKLFYPLSFPISVGPGSISVIMALMANTSSIKGNPLSTWINYAVIVFSIIAILSILYLFLSQGHKIIKKLGASGSLIINKMIAFITFCIGIQILVTGISKIFHINIL